MFHNNTFHFFGNHTNPPSRLSNARAINCINIPFSELAVNISVDEEKLTTWLFNHCDCLTIPVASRMINLRDFTQYNGVSSTSLAQRIVHGVELDSAKIKFRRWFSNEGVTHVLPGGDRVLSDLGADALQGYSGCRRGPAGHKVISYADWVLLWRQVGVPDVAVPTRRRVTEARIENLRETYASLKIRKGLRAEAPLQTMIAVSEERMRAMIDYLAGDIRPAQEIGDNFLQKIETTRPSKGIVNRIAQYEVARKILSDPDVNLSEDEVFSLGTIMNMPHNQQFYNIDRNILAAHHQAASGQRQAAAVTTRSLLSVMRDPENRVGNVSQARVIGNEQPVEPRAVTVPLADTSITRIPSQSRPIEVPSFMPRLLSREREVRREEPPRTTPLSFRREPEPNSETRTLRTTAIGTALPRSSPSPTIETRVGTMTTTTTTTTSTRTSEAKVEATPLDEPEACVVCRNGMLGDDMLSIFPCGHSVHSMCIIGQSPTACYTCRQEGKPVQSGALPPLIRELQPPSRPPRRESVLRTPPPPPPSSDGKEEKEEKDEKEEEEERERERNMGRDAEGEGVRDSGSRDDTEIVERSSPAGTEEGDDGLGRLGETDERWVELGLLSRNGDVQYVSDINQDILDEFIAEMGLSLSDYQNLSP